MNLNPLKKNLLLVGAADSLAGILGPLLAEEYQLFGIDSRPLPPTMKFPGRFLQVGYTTRRLDEVFRTVSFEALIHIGRISSLTETSRKERFEQNIYGTSNLLQLGLKHHIKQNIVLGTHLVYGAVPENPLYMREEDPLRASEGHAEIFDAIGVDLETRAFLWHHRQVKTTLLRPVHRIGPGCQSFFSSHLSQPYCPKLLGFDPLLQIIDERDTARAIYLALKNQIFGVFNVAGEGVISYSKAMAFAGTTPLMIPAFAAASVASLSRLMGHPVPIHLMNYLQYPVIVSDQAFRKAVGWEPKITTIESLKSLAPH